MHNSVWVIDDDQSIRWVLEKALDQAGIETLAFASADQALETLPADPPTAILTDIRMPGEGDEGDSGAPRGERHRSPMPQPRSGMPTPGPATPTTPSRAVRPTAAPRSWCSSIPTPR